MRRMRRRASRKSCRPCSQTSETCRTPCSRRTGTWRASACPGKACAMQSCRSRRRCAHCLALPRSPCCVRPVCRQDAGKALAAPEQLLRLLALRGRAQLRPWEAAGAPGVSALQHRLCRQQPLRSAMNGSNASGRATLHCGAESLCRERRCALWAVASAHVAPWCWHPRRG